MSTPAAEPPRRRSPSWTRRRGIPATEESDHSPWLRLHEHLVIRHGIRADLPRRWERPAADDALNLAVLLRQASAQVDRDLSRALVPVASGLTPTAVDALRRLRDKPSAGVNLAEYLVLSEKQVSRLLISLERAGLLDREPGWRDLRTRRTELTQHGRDVLDTVETLLAELTQAWMEGLDEVEVEALLCLLYALSDRPPTRPARLAVARPLSAARGPRRRSGRGA